MSTHWSSSGPLSGSLPERTTTCSSISKSLASRDTVSSERADGLRAGKCKWSPSPSPPPRSKTPQNGSSHENEKAENGAEASISTSQGPVLPPTESAAAATARPSNAIYRGARASDSEPPTTVTSGARPQPQPTMIGVPPNRVPEGVAAPGIDLPEGVHHGTQAAFDIHISPQNARDTGAYPRQDRQKIHVYCDAPRHGPCMAWDRGTSTERCDHTFSKKPGTDFEVLRKPLDPVSSTVAPSDDPKDPRS